MPSEAFEKPSETHKNATLIVGHEAYFMRNQNEFQEYSDNSDADFNKLTLLQTREYFKIRQPYRDAFKAFKKEPSERNAEILVRAEERYAEIRKRYGFKFPSILEYFKNFLAEKERMSSSNKVRM